MRDAFAVLFFVSVGMLFNPRSIVEAPVPIAMVLLVVIVGKPLAAFVTVRALGTPTATALPVAAAFSQVGEFSFILGTVARQLGLVTDTGWDALVAASILSIAVNPTVYAWAKRRSTPPLDLSATTTPAPVEIDPRRSILVGYGPVGRIVHRLLTDRGADVTVVDVNLETVRGLRARGIKAVNGDVLRAGTLDEAGIATAGSLLLSADVEEAAEIVRQALLLNPKLRVLARCAHLRDAAALRRAGAAVVAAGEAEVGVALAEAVTAGDALDPAAASAQRTALRARLYDFPPEG
jgi:CPA2 family monovalent cation:H+ antiporter-2